jgi:hypothetical protein
MSRSKDAAMLASVAVAAIAIVCCAGLPVLAGAFGGVALATALGVGGGLLAFIVALAAAVIVLRARRRRSCPPSDERPAS